MKKQLFLLMLSAVFILAGCDKENGDGGVFTPPTQEQLTQNAYADNENTGGGFSFTTDAPWTATVEEVLPQSPSSMQVKSATRSSGNNVVWLKLYNGNSEAYSGEAGTITLRIEIDQNYTGERREATITIRSGNNTFIVTVIQEGTKQDGSENEPPVKVTKITLDKTELSLETGAKATLTATVEPTDATIKSVAWSSSNSEVATVNPVTGEIVAIADGNAVITVTSSSNKEVSASCAVTVGNSEPVVTKAFVNKIERTVTYWDKFPATEYNEDEVTYSFEYDDRNRVSSYTIDFKPTYEDGKERQLISKIDYSSSDRLRIEDQWSDKSQKQTYDILLNEKGFITKGESWPTLYEPLETYQIEYNSEDRVSRIAYSKYWSTFVYKDGVLSGGKDFDGTDVYETSGFEQNFSQIANDKLNIDVNMLFIPGFFSEEPESGDVPSRLGRLALLRLAGRGMDRYITLDGLSWSQDETSMNLPEGWPEPNVTVHENYEFFSYDWDEELGLDYTFNNDGTVAAISASSTMQKIKKEFDIVVGNEPIHPEHLGAGYKYEIKNRKETVVDKGINTITYKFNYR
ncbi:Ig-like domain-containing protein [Phocaeicola coprocola]|uniref:Ig-like domain-containing protein n=1 Tax=Phocaeicola coprocola TaxID=310298 RepID=UPI0039960568